VSPLIRLLPLLAACQDVVREPVAEAFSPSDQIEQACKEYKFTCGRVRAFTEIPAENPLGLLEMCIRLEDVELAESEWGPSVLSPDPRFQPYKLWGIEPYCVHDCPATTGCNAYNGCYCPGAL
jgi:hypothetical protein